MSRVLWAAAPEERPAAPTHWSLSVADTQADALATADALDEAGRRLDAVVASPSLPDGDGGAVLRGVRDRWPDAACFLHGDLWAIPGGSELPVCEFHPESQSPADVAAAVSEAVERRYHRPYPIFEDEPRRLAVIDAVDFDAVRPRLDALLESVEAETGGDLAVVAAVDDYTVRFEAASRDLARRSMARRNTAATHALGSDGPTAIEDLAADDRIDHAAECGAGTYRAYVGHPYHVDGVPVGVVCALSGRPGEFSPDAADAMAVHADRVGAVLESAL